MRILFMERYEAFRIVLKQLRQEKNFTIEEFAEKISVDPKYYWRIEKGLSIPTISKIDYIYDVLELKPNKF